MKNIKIKKITLLLATFIFVLATSISCASGDRDDIINSEPEHEHDEISKVVLQFRNITDLTLIYEFTYIAPEGTTELPVTDINLPAGTYDVEIKLYTTSGNTYKEVTDEIFIEDADDHFVFYQKINATGLTITYADDDMVDTLGRKLGQRTVWTLEGQGNAGVYIYLLHEPAQKDTEAQSTSQLGGEIDLEAHFSITAK